MNGRMMRSTKLGKVGDEEFKFLIGYISFGGRYEESLRHAESKGSRDVFT